MYSDHDNECSHSLGFPIRKSPDHRLLASSRGLSQLTTSFIAYLRQGIHTHALSSLTIKSTSNTNVILVRYTSMNAIAHGSCITYSFVMPVKYSDVKDRITNTLAGFSARFQLSRRTTKWKRCECLFITEIVPSEVVGLGGLEPPTSPLSGVRSSHLSYRPIKNVGTGGAGRDRTGDLLSANQALSQLSYSP